MVQDFTDEIPWHALPIHEVLEKLVTSTEGLTSAQASQRIAQFGPNVLPVRKPPGIARIFLHQFKSPLIYILLFAAFISFLLHDIKDGSFILVVVSLNAVIGMVQEWKAEQKASRLSNLLEVSCCVIRDQKKIPIPASGLVPGDLVCIESGNHIPADIRLIHATHLTVDESLLTGESIPAEKIVTVMERDIPVSDWKNIVFGGTVPMTGQGLGIVIHTGIKTQVGIIAKAVATTEASKPPLVIRMEQFSRRIGLIVIGACIMMAAVSLSRGVPYTEVFFLAVALSVSAIPEGLPVAITVALSIAASRMGMRNVIVRRLAAVEGLGSCTMIATDKTGTLTVNEQTVQKVILPSEEVCQVTGIGYEGIGEVVLHNPDLSGSGTEGRCQALAIAGIVCNEASLYQQEGRWLHYGDAMDVALLSFGYKAGIDPDQIRNQITILGTIPFEAENRYSAVYYTDESGIIRIAVKGAYEIVISYCSYMQAKKKVKFNRLITDQHLASLTGEGFRVLAFAQGQMDQMPEGELELGIVSPSLTFLGLTGSIDPIRPGVLQAVSRCKNAGIEIAMITGDHPDTSLVIGRQLGLARSHSEVVTGQGLCEIGPSDLPEYAERVSSVHIFSRVSPVQKLAIVDCMIKAGHFVAVTGDGVNDAPAIRRANIGVAMGSGSDVAKDTASLIITDDSFSSIVAGIEEGRFAYDNIRKVTYLLISTGFAEIILFTLSLFVGIPVPLLAVQLLWLNLVTNGIQDVTLAFEKGEPDTMTRPPRKPGEGIFNSLMIQETVISAVYIGSIAFAVYYWMLSQGVDIESARNMIVLLMVLLENFHAVNCRSEYRSILRIPIKNNYFLIFGIIIAQLVHIAAMLTPYTQDLLGIEPVSLLTWFRLLSIAFGVVVVMELFKRIRFGFKHRQ